MSKLKNWEIIDCAVYKTTHWQIETHPEEGEGDIYYVRCEEDDFSNIWYVNSRNEGTIDDDTELFNELIEICERAGDDIVG